MVKYKEFIREKLQKLNNLPKKWQQIIICILVIIVAIIYCFSGEEKTKIAVSEKVENKNTIISANGEDEEKNSKMIYNILIVLVHFLLYKLINIVPILIEILK